MYFLASCNPDVTLSFLFKKQSSPTCKMQTQASRKKNCFIYVSQKKKEDTEIYFKIFLSRFDVFQYFRTLKIICPVKITYKPNFTKYWYS